MKSAEGRRRTRTVQSNVSSNVKSNRIKNTQIGRLMLMLMLTLSPSMIQMSMSGLGLGLGLSSPSLLPLVVGVEALDIGKALKNIGTKDKDKDKDKDKRDRFGSGSGSGNGNGNNEHEHEHAIVTTTEEQGGVQIVKTLIRDSISNDKKEKEELERQLEQRRRQEMIDASTGTVTSMSNIHTQQQQQQHVSCNEIMAKAVVVASEEKDEAYQLRDDALHKLHQANVQIESLASQLEVATHQAKNATIEAEATKLMTQRLMEDYKSTKDGEMEELIVKHDATIQKLYHDLDSTKDDYETQLETQQNTYKAKMDQIQADAKEDILKLKDSVDDEKAKLEAQSVQLELQMKDERKELELNYTTMNDQLVTDHNIEIESLHSHYETIITNKDDTIDQLKATISSNEQSYKERISKITTAHNEQILTIQTDHQKEYQRTMDEAYEIERNVQREMVQLKQDVDTIISENNKKAKAENERIVSSAQDEVNRILEEMTKQVDEKEEQIALLQSTSSALNTKQESIISGLEEDVEDYKDIQSSLQRKLDLMTQEMEYWKDVGSHPTHVNTTLISIDFERYATNMKSHTKNIVSQYSNEKWEKVQTVSEPHVVKVQEMYNGSQMKEYIDLYVVPNYQKYIPPVQEQIRSQIMTTYNEKIVPHYDNAIKTIQTNAVQITSNIAKQLLTSIEFEDPESKTNILVRLRDEEPYALQFVTVLWKCILVVLVFMFRYTILRWMWKVVSFVIRTPFQIMWFFCPLRLVLRGGGGRKGGGSKSGGGASIGKDKKGSGNGYSRTKVKGTSSSSSSGSSTHTSRNGTTYKNGTSGSVVTS